MGQISYFLFYPSSGTAGIMPRSIPIRVRRHGPPCGFNVTTRSKGQSQVLLRQPTRLRLYVCCGPSHGWSNRWDEPLMSHSPYESAQPAGQPTLRYTQPHGPESSYELGHTLQHGSHPTARVTPYGTGHTLQAESTHGSGHPTEWVAPWVRSVPIVS